MEIANIVSAHVITLCEPGNANQMADLITALAKNNDLRLALGSAGPLEAPRKI